MSKKLMYGGVEVTPADPRLPEILATIVEMVRNISDEIKVVSGSHNGNTLVKTISPKRRVEISEDDVTSGHVDKPLPVGLFTMYEYKGELHPNKAGLTIADCINQPGFKVVDEEEN